MATLLVHITVHAGAEAKFEALIAELYTTTHADEPGVVRYEYWRGSDPRSYYTLISYDDFDGFIAHQTSDHHEEASPRLREMVESIRLEWVDPVSNASPLPPTDGSSSTSPVDDLTARDRERFAADIATWWLPLR